ncbi:hypothetical protein CSPX01_14571 [Colletotrichum filicis]|nr:hypothetical protein CSPX01_14571 [Colletotrichum filicis]
MPTMEKFNHSVNRAFLPLLALFIWLMPQLVSGQTAIQTQSVPGIMPTLAGPSKPRITPWDEECTTRGLIRPWMYDIFQLPQSPKASDEQNYPDSTLLAQTPSYWTSSGRKAAHHFGHHNRRGNYNGYFEGQRS